MAMNSEEIRQKSLSQNVVIEAGPGQILRGNSSIRFGESKEEIPRVRSVRIDLNCRKISTAKIEVVPDLIHIECKAEVRWFIPIHLKDDIFMVDGKPYKLVAQPGT